MSQHKQAQAALAWLQAQAETPPLKAVSRPSSAGRSDMVQVFEADTLKNAFLLVGGEQSMRIDIAEGGELTLHMTSSPVSVFSTPRSNPWDGLDSLITSTRDQGADPDTLTISQTALARLLKSGISKRGRTKHVSPWPGEEVER